MAEPVQWIRHTGMGQRAVPSTFQHCHAGCNRACHVLWHNHRANAYGLHPEAGYWRSRCRCSVRAPSGKDANASGSHSSKAAPLRHPGNVCSGGRRCLQAMPPPSVILGSCCARNIDYFIFKRFCCARACLRVPAPEIGISATFQPLKYRALPRHVIISAYGAQAFARYDPCANFVFNGWRENRWPSCFHLACHYTLKRKKPPEGGS